MANAASAEPAARPTARTTLRPNPTIPRGAYKTHEGPVLEEGKRIDVTTVTNGIETYSWDIRQMLSLGKFAARDRCSYRPGLGRSSPAG